MLTVYTLVSTIQLFSLLYLLYITWENSRAYSLAKNPLWVQKQILLKKGFVTPSKSVLFTLTTLSLASLIYALRSQSQELLFQVKTVSLILVVSTGAIYHVVTRKAIERQIPIQTQDSAPVNHRRVTGFASPRLWKLAIVSSATTAVLAVTWLIMDDLNPMLFLYNLIVMVVFYGVTYSAVFYFLYLRKPTPGNSVYRKILSNEYSTFAIKTLLVSITLTSCALMGNLFINSQGTILWQDKLLSALAMGKEDFYTRVLVSGCACDMLVSVVSIVVILWISFSATLQKNRSSRLFTQSTANPAIEAN